MKENQNENLIENDTQQPGCQLLGFLAPGGGGLVLSSYPGSHAAGTTAPGSAPPVMAIPISALFVKHESRRKQAANKTA